VSLALSNLEQSVREQVSRSESALASLEADLRATDAELVALAEDHNKYQKLEHICTSLEELDELGAGHLFWDEGSNEHKATHLDHARSQIGKYHEAIVEVENRRDAIAEDIKQHNVELDCLHYDLQDIVEQQEDNRYQWLTEREDSEKPKHQHMQVMPWARGCEEDRRFRRSLASSLAASLAIAMMISTIAIPFRERAQEMELPERVARLVRQERELPPPPPPVQEQEVPDEDIPEPEAEPELVEELPPCRSRRTSHSLHRKRIPASRSSQRAYSRSRTASPAARRYDPRHNSAWTRA
jgi:hypothetical protein